LAAGFAFDLGLVAPKSASELIGHSEIKTAVRFVLDH